MQARDERGGLRAPLHAEFGEEARYVVLHGLLGEVHRLPDLTVGQSLADQVKDAHLLLGEGAESLVVVVPRARPLEDALAQCRVQEARPRGHGADRVDEVVAADVLEHVARGAGHDRVEERLVIGVRRQHEVGDTGHRVAQVATHLNPAAVGKPDVEDRDLGSGGRDPGQGLGDCAGLTDNLQIGLEFEEIGETPPHDFMVVEEEDPDRRHLESMGPSGWGRVEGWRAMTTETDPVQLLTPEGQRVAHPVYDIELSDAELRDLYRDLVMVRRLDTEATALQRQGELGLWASSLGQEAAQVGSAAAMRASDFAFPTYRDHGVALMRGVQPLQILGLYRGVTNGGWNPLEHRCGLYTIVIGNQALHGVGYAMGQSLDGSDEATITYFGDGATAQGDVNEAFVFASVFSAPVVFFCQNNQWAISQPRERQSMVPIHQRAAGFGFPGVFVDGNDILAVMAVTRAALERARSGNGPTLIEAYTYRMGAHTTSDDPTRYRMGDEVERWRLRDPIERLKVYLAHEGIADRMFFDTVESQADEMAEGLRAGVRALVPPAADSIFDHVYAETHPTITRQRADFVDYHAGFADEVAR